MGATPKPGSEFTENVHGLQTVSYDYCSATCNSTRTDEFASASSVVVLIALNDNQKPTGLTVVTPPSTVNVSIIHLRSSVNNPLLSVPAEISPRCDIVPLRAHEIGRDCEPGLAGYAPLPALPRGSCRPLSAANADAIVDDYEAGRKTDTQLPAFMNK